MDASVPIDKNVQPVDWDDVHRRLEALKEEPEQQQNFPEKEMIAWLCDRDDLLKRGLMTFVGAMERYHRETKLSLSSIFGQTGPSGNTLLHLAAAVEDQDILKAVMDHLPNEIIARENNSGDSALHVAARNGRLESVKAILCRIKANDECDKGGLYLALQMKNKGGNTALHEAVKSKSKSHEVIPVLTNEDSAMRYVQNKERKSPFYLAVEGGNIDIVRLLLERGVTADRIQGMSPVHAAIMHQNMEMLKEMSKKRELFQLKDAKQRNPLHLAAFTNYVDAVSFMLDKFPKSAVEYDGAGYFPIHIAGKKGHVSVIKIMFTICCYDPTELLTKNGQNIVHISAKYEGIECLGYILSDSRPHIMLLNQQDEDGNTPLHLAAMHFKARALLFLTRKRDIDVTLVNHDCLTALDAAEKHLKSVDVSFEQALALIVMRVFGVRRSKDLPIRGSTGFVLQPPDKKITKAQVNTRLVVATLVATVTFAAGFAVPGGLNSSGSPQSEEGLAVMLHHGAFQAFAILNCIAMYSSIVTVSYLLWTQASRNPNVAASILSSTTVTMLMALLAASGAFMAGTYLTMSKLPWLACVSLLIGSLYFYLMVNLVCIIATWFSAPVGLKITVWETVSPGRGQPFRVFFFLFGLSTTIISFARYHGEGDLRSQLSSDAEDE